MSLAMDDSSVQRRVQSTYDAEAILEKPAAAARVTAELVRKACGDEITALSANAALATNKEGEWSTVSSINDGVCVLQFRTRSNRDDKQ